MKQKFDKANIIQPELTVACTDVVIVSGFILFNTAGTQGHFTIGKEQHPGISSTTVNQSYLRANRKERTNNEAISSSNTRNSISVPTRNSYSIFRTLPVLSVNLLQALNR